MKPFLTGLAAAILAATPIALSAQEAATAITAPETSFVAMGEAPTDAELDQRGGKYFAVVWGGVVWATKSCKTNKICTALATAALKALAKTGAKAIYEDNKPALHKRLCQMKITKYC